MHCMQHVARDGKYKDSFIILYHLDDFAPICHPGKALGRDLTVFIFACHKGIPPPEEEVTSNQLEPRSEFVGFGK